MILVINEWIFHDLLGENGLERFRSAAAFLVKLDGSNDRIVMPPEERWRRKAFQLMTATGPVQREVSKVIHNLLRDTERCISLEQNDIPAESRTSYDWAPEEDVYLLQAYSAASADLLITTDEELFEKARERGEIACRLRDEFLSTYGTPG